MLISACSASTQREDDEHVAERGAVGEVHDAEVDAPEVEQRGDERRAAVVDRGDDGDEPDEVEPAGEPAPGGAAELARPPVDAARGRIRRDELGHAERDQQDHAGDQRPADRDRDRAAVVPRLAVGREAAGQDRDDRERDREVREPAPRARSAPACSPARRAAARRGPAWWCSCGRLPSGKRSGDRPSAARIYGAVGRKSSDGSPERPRAAGRPARARCPCRCSAMIRIARSPSPRRTAASIRACCWFAQASSSGGWAMWAIRSLISPWASVIAATSRPAAGRLGEPDVPAHVGLPVARGSPPAPRPSRPRARRAARAPPRSARSAASTATASSTASRWSQASRQPASSSAEGASAGGGGVGHERAAAAPARRASGGRSARAR